MDGAASSFLQPDDPNELLAKAMSLLAAGDLSDALSHAEAARRAYNHAGWVEGELDACLLLGRIHHLREDLGSAAIYTEEVATLLRRYPALPPEAQAKAYLGLARLAPDVGQLIRGLEFGQLALRYYELSRNIDGQLDAILLISALARQMGRFQMAAAYLEMARSHIQLSGQRAWTVAWHFNGEIHHHWYQGNFAIAAELGWRAVAHADAENLGKYQIYQRLALANVLRGLGKYAEAEACYLEAEAVLFDVDFLLFRPWIEVNWAWLNILTKDYATARQRIFRALATSDRGQAASFNAFLAALYSLTSRYADAEQLLRQSLQFYQTSGDELSIFALRCHLAYLHLQRDQIKFAEEEMTLAFDWAAQWNVDYYPHWWHPQIMSTVCAHAFVANLHAGLAERILVKRLGKEAIPALQRLLVHPTPITRRRAADALSLLNMELLNEILASVDGSVHEVLAELFADGRLQVQRLPALSELLSTTREEESANPVVLATFGLYLDGWDRRSIAERLSRSEKTIRNYITLIYERFGLSGFDGPRRRRIQELHRLAAEAGFVRSDLP